MSGGRVTIGGTNYQIVGGRTNIGTAYDIPRGKVTVGGTNYTIKLYPRNIKHLLMHLEACDWDSNTSPSEATVYVSDFARGSGTYYLFSINQGLLSIHKVVYNATNKTVTTTQFGSATSNYQRFNYLYVEGNGTNSLKLWHTRSGAPTQAWPEYNCMLILFYLPTNSYTVAEADSILSNITISRTAARSSGGSSATATLTTDTSNLTGKIAYVVADDEFSFTRISAYNNYQVLNYGLANNPSLLYMTSSTAGISKTGTSNTAILNGAIGTIA